MKNSSSEFSNSFVNFQSNPTNDARRHLPLTVSSNNNQSSKDSGSATAVFLENGETINENDSNEQENGETPQKVIKFEVPKTKLDNGKSVLPPKPNEDKNTADSVHLEDAESNEPTFVKFEETDLVFDFSTDIENFYDDFSLKDDDSPHEDDLKDFIEEIDKLIAEIHFAVEEGKKFLKDQQHCHISMICCKRSKICFYFSELSPNKPERPKFQMVSFQVPNLFVSHGRGSNLTNISAEIYFSEDSFAKFHQVSQKIILFEMIYF